MVLDPTVVRDFYGHVFEEKICTRCLRPWSFLHRSRRWCPGVPWYKPGLAPEGLMSFSQAKVAGLAPKDRKKPVACVVTAHSQVVYLFNNFIPRRKETDRQREARIASWAKIQEKWKCTRCKELPDNLADIHYYWRKAGQCLACYEMEKWMAAERALDEKIANDRKRKIAWAKDLLSRTDWCILDTETTGLNGMVCEIGLLAPDGTVLFNELVNPEVAVESGALAVHGISNAMLSTARTLAEQWPQLQQALAGKSTIICYNVPFDKARMSHSAKRYDLPAITQTWECAMEAYSAYCGNWNEYHHSYTWVRLPSAGHRAIEDCKATLDVIKEMAASE